ncbi:unnamed protein product [Timema podura]|uniref:Nucleolar protein 11 n=1 Tax=Timema podura TaxID=61482 RepID=A0ABN7NG65_TIMPD|nr:unnamed protein product [Timema podura]
MASLSRSALFAVNQSDGGVVVNQKQVGSWSTKDKLTSPVVYDRGRKQYVGVFIQSQLRLWARKEEHLDKIKKHKFKLPIYYVFSENDKNDPVVVFLNGLVLHLSDALQKSKEDYKRALLKPDQVIEDCKLVTHEHNKYVILLTKNSRVIVPTIEKVRDFVQLNSLKENFLWLEKAEVIYEAKIIKNTNGKFNLPRQELVISQKTVSEKNLVLHIMPVTDGEPAVHLKATRTDGKRPLFSDEFPGNLVHVVSAVSTKHPVAITALSSNHLAMFGADPSEEGARLLIYNLQFNLVQSHHQFKLFSNPPKMWHVDQKLLVAIGGNLAVVPYQLETERLEALVGSHKTVTQQAASDVEIVTELQEVAWTKDNQIEDTHNDAPQIIQQELRNLESSGRPQSSILEDLLPKLIEKGNISSNESSSQHLSSSATREEKMDVDGYHTLVKVNGEVNKGVSFPSAVCQLLNATLNIPFSDMILLPYLRNVSFSYTLILLRYLVDFQIDKDDTEVVLDQEHILEWVTLLLDAHYQQYLLSKDPQILGLVKKLRHSIDIQLSYMEELKSLAPLLQGIAAGKPLKKRSHLSNKWYSIDHLRLY